MIIKADNEGVCKFCGKSTNFSRFDRGYYEFCSLSCAGKSKKTVNKRKESCLKKYGDENFRNVNLAEKTNLERYGVKYPSQLQQFKTKTKETNLKKYGKDHHMYNDEIKDKVKNTHLEKYGVITVLQNNDIREKVKMNCLNKYGVDNVFKSDKIRKKGHESLQNRTGEEKNKSIFDNGLTEW